MAVLDRTETAGQACPARTGGRHRVQWPTILLITLIAGVALLRLGYTTQMTVFTGDLIRNICYGRLVNNYGFEFAERPLASLRDLGWVCWSGDPYIYPILSLVFFKCIAAIAPTLFLDKLVLTLIEGANSLLVWRLTRERWLAALYWASPLSIWWVSREGQFEPLQNLFTFGALCLLGPCAPLAFFVLALAIQVKLTAVLLLPYFLIVAWRRRREKFFACLLGLLGGTLPTILALNAYPALNMIANNLANMHYNPYYWNPFVKNLRDWLPWWLVIINQAATYGVAGVLGWKFLRSPQRWEYLAPLLLLIAMKAHTNVQPWYFIVWTALLLPISDRRLRLTLFALLPLLDISSTLSICHVYLGPKAPAFYQMINVFEPLLR